MKKIFAALAAAALACAATAQSLGQIGAQRRQADAADGGAIAAKAMAGDAAAQLALGSFYAKGANGFPADAAKAVEWLEKSAAQNEKAAMAYLGYIYGEGKLVKRDFTKAVKWREAAANAGDANDKWSLGNAFLYGFLVPKDQLKALYWITLAAESGNADAVVKLVEIHENLGNKEELAKWRAKFAQMQLAAAESGNAVAMAAVAEKFMSGEDGLPRNRARAVFWYKKAADAGHAESIEKVAKMYARGRFLPQNQEKAQYYFEKLAEKDPSCCFKISSMYAEGRNGFPVDAKKSADWFARGAKNGDTTNRIYAAYRYWKIGETDTALKFCGEVEEEAGKSLSALGANAADPKNVQAAMLKRALYAAKLMREKISAGAKAPDTLDEYFAIRRAQTEL